VGRVLRLDRSGGGGRDVRGCDGGAESESGSESGACGAAAADWIGARGRRGAGAGTYRRDSVV